MTSEVSESPLAVSMMGLLTGGWVAQAVSVAARLGIADRLRSGPRSADDIASAVGAHPATLRRLLRALSDVGVFQEREDGLFAPTPLGDLLGSDTPGSLRGYALLVGAPFHRGAWTDLEHSVRTGEPTFAHVHGQELFHHLRDHPADGDVLNEAMISLSGQFIAPAVAACDFAPGHTIVDVGGGHGVVIAEVLAANPGTRGVLYDLPGVIADAGGPLRRAGVDDRCRMVTGDFFESVPSGCDTYVLCHIVHDWDDDRAVQILANCREAMKPDGRVLLGEGILHDGPSPSRIKWLDLEMLVMTCGGLQRTQAQYEHLFQRAGLRPTGIPAQGPTFSVLEARLA